MLVRTHDGRVDQLTFELRLVGHGVRHTFPLAFATPPREAHVHRMPPSEFLRQIAPGTTGPANPQDGAVTLAEYVHNGRKLDPHVSCVSRQ